MRNLKSIISISKRYSLALTISAVATLPALGATKPADNKFIYCMEENYADSPAWKVNFREESISTEGWIPSLDDKSPIKLSKDQYPENRPFPYGIYRGETSQYEKFMLLIYGLDMFNSNDSQLYFIARLQIGAEILEDVSCYSAAK